MPPEGLTLTEVAEIVEEQKRSTSFRYDEESSGLSFLHDFKDEDGETDFLFTRQTLQKMPWTHIKDTQARKRGFYFQAHMPQFTIYKNCKSLNIYVIRLQHKYTEYLMKHDGTKPVEVIPNFTPVLLEDQPFAIPTDHKITILDVTTQEIERDHCDEWVDPEPEDAIYHVSELKQNLLWTPIITPCSPACHVPIKSTN
jgi:hypothetical protein